MGESSARIGIYADDKASPTVKSVQGLMQGLAGEAKKSILTGVGLAGGVAAFGLLQKAIGGVTDFLGDSVKQAIADEESVSRLGQSLKANIPNWDGNTAAIEKRILAGQALGFSDDELRASLTLLVGATHDVGKAQELQAAAMDLARFKGIDLASASDALVKVEGGRYRILASLGIQLGKNATQEEVLAAIYKVASGQAKAYGDTTAGAMKAAEIAFDEAKESIGRSLMPAMKELAHFARDVLAPNMGLLVPVIGAVATVIVATLIPAIVAATIAAAPLIAALAVIGTTALIVSSEFDASGKAIGRTADDIKKGIAQLPPAFLDSAAKMREGGGRMADDVGASFHRIAESARKVPREMADALLAGQKDLADPIKQLLDFMKDALSPAQIMARDQGFLASSELAAGLASGNPLVRQRAQEMQAAAIAELRNLSGVYIAGDTIGTTWIKAIVEAIRRGTADMNTAVTGIRNRLGHSLPTEGPLKGDAAERGGLSIGKAWAGAIGKGIGLNMPSLGLPSAGGGRLAGVGAPSNGVGEIHIHIDQGAYIDGPSVDRLANVIASRLRFAPGT